MRQKIEETTSSPLSQAKKAARNLPLSLSFSTVGEIYEKSKGPAGDYLAVFVTRFDICNCAKMI